jgi:BirA family biotin operon repressor/biotin-[acetyl-CoA-carboxylase] ligase
VQLKWPNDLYAQGHKLGGVLVELQGEPAGQGVAVIGLGINLHMPAAARAGIDQPWTDLHALLGDQSPGRNRLAAALVVALARALPRFEREGFADFRDAWSTLDLFRDREVVLEGGARPVHGRAAGIDTDGALLIEQGGTLTRHLSGDVSLRACG